MVPSDRVGEAARAVPLWKNGCPVSRMAPAQPVFHFSPAALDNFVGNSRVVL